ncbi:NAD-dependent histone deacetylase sir2 [Pestalotiopsis sp. IQ-011]
MSNQVVVVITGAGRGIGKSLSQAYLARPNHIVVGSIRDDTAPGVAESKASPKGDGSRLLLVKIESASPQDAGKAVKEMEAEGIDHIDILIPNAGVSPPVEPIETVDLGVLSSAFNVNAMGPLALYQACFPLLKKSSNAKAAHWGNEWLTAVALNPGLVHTDMGSKTAKYLGLEKAPWTPKQSAEKLMGIIDQASREKYSGKFVNAINGDELPW